VPDNTESPKIVLTDGADSGSPPSWWETAKRWIKTPGALYLTALLLIVSGAQALASWKQWRTMQRQLDTMEKALPSYEKSADAAKQSADVARSSLTLSQQSFKVQQRPYVWVKTPVVTHEGAVSGKPIFMDIYFINAGVTPALEVSNHVYVKFSEVTDADFNGLRSLFEKVGNEKGGVLTHEGSLYVTAVSGKRKTLWTLEPIPWNGSDPIFVYGRIEYLDVFGDAHSTEFCWHYLVPNQVFMSCPNHNGIDLPKVDVKSQN
jgi:hypothetical protein